MTKPSLTVPLKPIASLPIRSSDAEIANYETRYNKFRPFKVNISPENIQVFFQDCDTKGVCITRQESFSWEYDHFFIGDLTGTSPGNTLLIGLKTGEYVFIGGDHIYAFRTFPKENLMYYVSSITDKGVPYPYAIGKTHTYFLMDKTALPNRVLDLKTDAYAQFQYKKELNTLRKPVKLIWQKVQGSLIDYEKCQAVCKQKSDKRVKRYQFKKSAAESLNEPSVYQTHYNNDRPFLVKVFPEYVEVYQQECTSEGCTTRNKILVSDYKEIFYGDIQPAGPNTPKKGDQYGNTILLRLKTGEYVYIGDRIYSFKISPGDRIQYYTSPIGDFDIPYPYAIGKTNTYFMLHKKYIPNRLLNFQMNPYSQFFFNKELKNAKKSFAMVWDYTKDAVEEYQNCLTRCARAKVKRSRRL
jgi:hypothetical protein